MIGQASITSPFGVGAVVTTLIALTFWLDRRFRTLSFLGTAILVIMPYAAGYLSREPPAALPRYFDRSPEWSLVPADAVHEGMGLGEQLFVV